MVIISLPETMENFEGEISHIVVAGNERLTFIKPIQWQEVKKKISIKLRNLAQSLKKFELLSAVKSGEVYIANVQGSLERSFIIRRPTPETYSIYLIDKGIQCEAQFDDIYEFPSELLNFALFSCICPVFIPSTEQLNIYEAFIGQKCKCKVETISKSFVVMGYVRGRLLIESGDLYEDLQDIVYRKLENRLNNFAKGSIRYNLLTNMPEEDTISWTTSEQIDDELTYRCSSTEKAARSTRIFGRTSSRKNYIASKKIKCGKHRIGHTDAKLFTAYDIVTAQELFMQTAFKQYKPDVIPTILSVRFDKKDRTLGRFWVINRSIFSTIERILKESAKKITKFPLLFQRFDEDIQMKEIIPCVVRTRADSTYKALHRAVPSRFDARTKRFSIFLVDFGWFKWVPANDVIDISAMDKFNPIRNLPVAMIHCREDVTSVIHAKDLSKGTNCYIRVKGSWAQDIYLVDLLQSHGILTGVINGKAGGILPSRSEANERQFLASLMLRTSNNANRNLVQPEHTWPHNCPAQFPMMMPVAFPMMVPMPFPNAAPPTVEYGHILKLQNSHKRNVKKSHACQTNAEDPACSRNNNRQRFQGSKSQNMKEEWCRSNLLGKNRIGFATDNKAENYFDENNSDLSWEQGSSLTKDHRILRKNFGSNLHRIRLTSWEQAISADGTNRTQASAIDELTVSHANDESN